jgi:MFS family permease
MDADERRAVLGASALSFFVRSGFGLILPGLPLYIRAHAIPVPDLGLASAAYMGLGIAGMLLLAPLADRFGAVRALVAGSILYLAGTTVLLAVPSAAALLAGRALQGLAMALTTPASFAYITAAVAPDRRGTAFGTVASAQMAGFIVGPSIGGVALGVGGPAAALSVALGASVLALVAALSLPRRATGTAPSGREGLSTGNPWRGFPALLAAPWAIAFLAFTIGQQIPFGVYDTVWSLFMFHLGAPTWLVGASYATWALPLVILSPLVGRRVPAARVDGWLVLGGFVVAAAAASYGLLHSPYAVAALGMLEGAGSAAVLPLSNVYLAGRVAAGRMATVQGLVGATGQAAALLAAVAAGYGFELRPWLPFLLASAGCAAGTAWFWRRGRGRSASPALPAAGDALPRTVS